jgi:hypothetical protein
MRQYLSFVLVLGLLVVWHPQKTKDSPGCVGYVSGICLDDGAAPAEQSMSPDDGDGS